MNGVGQHTSNLLQTHCPLCTSNNDAFIMQGRDPYLDRNETFKVVKCLGCGLLRLKTVLPPEQLEEWYEAHYGGHQQTLEQATTGSDVKDQKSPNRGLLRKLAQLNYQNHVASILPAEGKILEVGCGTGNIIAQLKERGAEVTGIEPDKAACNIARLNGLEVYSMPFEEFHEHGKKYDHILFSYVLEHIPDPVSTLKLAGKLLQPNGQIHIFTPNNDSLARHLFKSNWMSWHIPYNKVFFTKQTLSKSIDAAGLRVEKMQSLNRADELLESCRIARAKKNNRNIIEFPTKNRFGLLFFSLVFRPFNLIGYGNILYGIASKIHCY